jgi:hypothetical protein
MPAKYIPAYVVSGQACLNRPVTLTPLSECGRAALAPDLALRILYIALCVLVLRWRNAFNQKTIYQADDLFACAAAFGHSGDLIPKGADLVQATLSVQFADAMAPRTVVIVPPDTLTLEDRDDASRIIPLLIRRGFSKARSLVLALLLAAASVLPDSCCWADTPDSDTDDRPHVGILTF